MRVSRDTIAAILASAAVVVVVTLGFWKTHGPSAQRLVRTDEKRIQNLNRLANEINSQYRVHDKHLPEGLSDAEKKQFADPVTGKPPEYSSKPLNHYTLCTTFATESPKEELNEQFVFWIHPAGPKCFEFDAAEQVPQVQYFYY